MAGKEEVILRRDGHGVAHERGGIDGERGGHSARNTVKITTWTAISTTLYTIRQHRGEEKVVGQLGGGGVGGVELEGKKREG